MRVLNRTLPVSMNRRSAPFLRSDFRIVRAASGAVRCESAAGSHPNNDNRPPLTIERTGRQRPRHQDRSSHSAGHQRDDRRPDRDDHHEPDDLRSTEMDASCLRHRPIMPNGHAGRAKSRRGGTTWPDGPRANGSASARSKGLPLALRSMSRTSTSPVGPRQARQATCGHLRG